MCTPWTLRRCLVGHQAKDGRHKPSKTRFPLEDETKDPIFATTEQSNNAQPSSSTSSPRQDRAANNEAALAASRMSAIKRGKHKRKVTIGSNHTSSGSSSLGDVDGGGNADETDWPPFTDEDYIVFCFEEDGEFHLVMDGNSKSQDCSEHGLSPRPFNQKFKGDNGGDLASPSTPYINDIMDDNRMNRRDCLLPNKAIEEERFYFSPRLQSDGIKSLTRFKEEVDDEDMKVVKARGRVDEEMDYDDMDGIKRRGQCNLDEQADVLSEDDNLECQKTSMECRDGSVESTGSSQPDWVRHLQVTKTDQEIGLSSSSPAHDEPSSSTKGKLVSLMYTRKYLLSSKKVDDDESIYLSSESQQGGSQGDEEHSNEEESAETSDTSELEEDEEEEEALSSSSSFQFPVLEWDWIGSPVEWPKSKSISLRKPKSSRVCLRCCRF